MVSGGPAPGTRAPVGVRGAGTAPRRLPARLLGSLIPVLGPRSSGSRVPQVKRCRWPGDRSWPLSALVTRREGAALGGGGREPGVPGTVSGHNQVMRDKGELVRPLKGEGKEKNGRSWA